MRGSSFEKFRQEMRVLRDKFLKHRDQYKGKTYNETDLRNEFLNRMCIALGWDIENREGLSPSEREVWLERGDCAGKRPDYNFRIAGKTKFYLEAKAPHVNVQSPDEIHQAKSYAWSTTESLVSVAVISNFEETILFDATLVPDFDYPERGRLFPIIRVEDLDKAKALETLWLLSREEMEKGTLETLIQKDRKRVSFRVRPDDRLLDLLNEFRVRIGGSIRQGNPKLEVTKIADIVGTLLHRLLFIRVLEDRGTIDKKELKDLVDDWEQFQGKKGEILINTIREQFSYINENFNGKLFDGDPLKGIKVDAKVIADVVKNLYGRRCPFAFNQLDVNTLGHIYEKFLSWELYERGRGLALRYQEYIRKAGGVFYTPREVVALMCEESVRPVVREASDLLKIRILDPACGSGTFLLSAYQIMLRETAVREKCTIETIPFADKRDLLLKCIHGVDIDSEATKVAILSLCLAALEGEPHISKGKRLLPNLRQNIVVADSLLDKPLLGRSIVDLKAFPPKGNALCIVSNPPYLNVKRDFFESSYKEYLETHYSSASGQWDSYCVFLERAMQWKPSSISFIVPKPILTNENQTTIRRLLAENRLASITDVGMVFKDASVEAVVLNCGPKTVDLIETKKWRDGNTSPLGMLKRKSIEDGEAINIYSRPEVEKVFRKIEAAKKRLSGYVTRPILRGIEKGKNALVDSNGRGRARCHSGVEVQERIAGTPERFIDVDWDDAGTYKDKSLYKGPKVLIRRVTNDLLASVDNSDHVCLNTLYVAHPAEPLDPSLLVALTSSKIIQFWFKCKYVNDDALFPYVRTNQVADVPLPSELEAFCSKARGLAEHVVGLERDGESKERTKFEKLVAGAFDLTDAEFQLVLDTLEERKRSAAG